MRTERGDAPPEFHVCNPVESQPPDFHDGHNDGLPPVGGLGGQVQRTHRTAFTWPIHLIEVYESEERALT